MSITENIKTILDQLPTNVKLVAVSKTKPETDIMQAYSIGQRIFGENKVQELCDKQSILPSDIEWHFIGHLQTNKVKYIAPFVSMIHAVDSFKLLQEINHQAKKNNRIISCLLQFHIAQEENKFGFNFEEVEAILQNKEFVEMQNIALCGVMGMASFVTDSEQISDEFRTLNNYFLLIKSHYFKFNDQFKEISMGMSNDFQLGIDEGSTLIRIGSTIFGGR